MTIDNFRVGVIGFAHMHVLDLMRSFAAAPEVQWVACADTPARVPSICDKPTTRSHNMRAAMEDYGVPRAYEDFRELLAKEQMDLVIVCCENAAHPEVACAALESGVSVLCEKPMASDYLGALKMARTAQARKKMLAINWPTAWHPSLRLARRLIDEGAIGRIYRFQYRNSTSLGPFSYGVDLTDEEKAAEWWYQPETGGGAYFDYVCYGACLSRYFLGAPAVDVRALKANFASPFSACEDYAALLARFPNATAIIEGSWSTLSSAVPHGPILFGETGVMLVRDDAVEIFRARKSKTPDETYRAEPLPEGREQIARELIHHLSTGEPLFEMLRPQINLDAVALLDAGARAAELERTVRLPDPLFTTRYPY